MSSNPSFTQVVDDMMEARLSRLNTMMPGKVVRVDVTKGQCDVQPILKGKFGNGELFDYPVLTNRPIAFYRAGKSFISLPVKVGDLVEIRYCQRSLDIWLSKGGSVDPKDLRKHALSDSVVYPGLYPFTDPPVGASASNLIVKNDKSVMDLAPDGTLILKNPNGEVKLGADGKYTISKGGDELIDLISQLAAKLSATDEKISQIMTLTMLGQMPPLNAADFVVLKSEVDTIKGKIDGLKG